jgi:hypothetical protein
MLTHGRSLAMTIPHGIFQIRVFSVMAAMRLLWLETKQRRLQGKRQAKEWLTHSLQQYYKKLLENVNKTVEIL